MKILVVDDDDIAQSMLENILTEAGHDVKLADEGQEALDMWRQGDFRLVVWDWDMPEMNGLELCRAIRSQGFSYTYVILLTSHNSQDHIVEGLSAGADDFLSKPFDPGELVVRIRAGERILALESRDVAIFAMAKLAESRDYETGMHLERIQNYCRVITQHLLSQSKFSDLTDPNYARLIYTTSPLHDIGKVGIPDAVLLKPGRLTDREFEIMQQHTTLGGETINAALHEFPEAKFLQMARDITMTHHEWYNGEGYPSNLKGNEIPLCGRIVALADVYDALISKRVYKEAFAHDIALSIITKESGTHFDPLIVDAFVEKSDEFIAIREQFLEGGIHLTQVPPTSCGVRQRSADTATRLS